MPDTKNNIMTAALRLFARYGYEAVSVKLIADELGMTKSALYKHYKNKRDIFDHIIQRMKITDGERADKHNVPQGPKKDMEETYRKTRLESIFDYAKAQFNYWTRDEFSSSFRKMLTLEQYGNPEMSRLYQQYIASGPLNYMEDVFSSITNDKAKAQQLALNFYAPMFLLYSVYDGADDKDAVTDMLEGHIESFAKNEALK